MKLTGRVKAMEIEIITTKKRLTKSVVDQMREVTLNALRCGVSLGYMINIRKDSYKTILINFENEYYVIPANYSRGETAVYRKIGKLSSQIKFNDAGACSEWWNAYMERLKEATNQIYI